MEKKTLLALAALAIFGAGAYGVMRAPEKGQRTGPPPRPVAVVKAADIAAVEITNGEKNETVAMEKRDAGWFLTKPTEWRADQTAMKQLTDGIEKLVFADIVTEGAEKHAEMGVAEKGSTRVVLKDKGGKTLMDLFIGKSVGGFTMARPADKTQVWQASGIYPYLFNRDLRGWRDHVVFDFPHAGVDQLTIEGGGQKLVLAREASAPDAGAGASADAKWKIVEATGDAPKTSELLDHAMATSVVQALAALRANDFADGKALAEAGLDKPSVTVTASAKGQTYSLLIGTMQSDDVYAKRADSPIVYTFKRYGIDRLHHPPIDYRDKTLVKAKDSDIQSIEIVSGAEPAITIEPSGGAWKARKGAFDVEKLKGIATAFENFAGSSFVLDKDPAKHGLSKPAGQVTVKLKDKSTVVLKIGQATKDNTEYYIQKAGNPYILLAKKYTVDRFFRKAKDLEISKAPPGPPRGPPGMPPPGMRPPGMPPGHP